MKTSEVYVSAENLYLMYKSDLDETFINECIHFQSHLQNIKYYPKSIIDMSTMMKKHELEDIFPYVSIALRMFLCTPATNCTAERSFSTQTYKNISNVKYIHRQTEFIGNFKY